MLACTSCMLKYLIPFQSWSEPDFFNMDRYFPEKNMKTTNANHVNIIYSVTQVIFIMPCKSSEDSNKHGYRTEGKPFN